MENPDLFLFLLLSLFSEILGTIGGFGSSVFFVPMASHFMAFKTVLGVTALYHVGSNLSKIALFRKGLDRTLLFYLGVPAVIAVIIGGILSKYIASPFLSTALGVVLVLLSIGLWLFEEKELKASKRNATAGGLLSGFFAGLVGTGGAVRGATMVAFRLPKDKFIATSAVIDLAIDGSRSIVYLANGYLSTNEIPLLLFLVGISLGGTYLGKLLLAHIPQKKFERLVLLLILLAGLYTIYRTTT